MYLQQPVRGLVGLDTAALRQRLSSGDTPGLTEHVDVSLATVGETSRLIGQSTFYDLSITNWRTELRNILATRGQKKSEEGASIESILDLGSRKHK